MTVRHSLDNKNLRVHFCLSNARVLVGKPFQYQALVAFPLSTTMTTGTSLPTPPPILTIEQGMKRYCSTISSADPPKTNSLLPKRTVRHGKRLKA
jgi:hypothetical protein